MGAPESMSVRIEEALGDDFRLDLSSSELRANWRNVGSLVASRDGVAYGFASAPNARPEVFAKMRDGIGAALLHRLRGGDALHAAVVARDGRAVALVGASGAGKSTTAAVVCARPGVALVSDDAVRLVAAGRRFRTLSNGDSHWLRSDAAERLFGAPTDKPKGRFEPPRTADASVELAAIVDLTFADQYPTAASLTPLAGASAFDALCNAYIRFDDEDGASRRDFDRIVALVDAVPVWRLYRARGLDHLGAAADIVEDLLKIHGAASVTAVAAP